MGVARPVMLASLLLGAAFTLPPAPAFCADRPRVIQVIADKDNRFKVPGQKKPVLTVKAKEVIRLRITARRGTEWEDDAVHSFTIWEFKDQGWDLRLKEGTHEFTLVAPAEAGEYVVECLVKCGPGHEEMQMKLVVTP